MLLYICKGLIFLSVLEFSQVKTLEPSNVKTVNDGPKLGDTIFADVIKNISRVNHVLQELINNYEQLQKIYKSQENVDSVDSDSEIDEVYKSKNGKKLAKRTRERTTTRLPVSEKFAATQMYWSDHEEDNENSNDETEDEKDAEKETAKEVKTLEPMVKETLSTRTTTLRPVSSEDSSDKSSDTSDVSPGKKAYKEVIEKKPNKLKLSDSVKKKPQSEVIFIDTHKKTKETSPAKSREIGKNKIDSGVQFAGVPTKKKTRYSKVSQGTNSEMQTQNVVSKFGSNDNREVKKIMYAESFSPKKIWNDILNNKPIQLEAHNEITLRRVERLKKENNTTNKRSKGVGKSAVVVVTKSKKKENKATLSSEEDDSTLKEQFKTNVLRQAYGDACLKLVLRKCHKACKKVSKTACNRVKCKRSAKSSFLTAARAGCIKEFNGNTAVTTGDKDNTITSFRGQSNKFVDMTRAGFLSAACLPHAEILKSTLRNASQSQTNPEQNFNILRDRYERACKRISSEKCRNACNYATTQMCEKNTCSKRMKKTFKKVCKDQCQTAYGLNKADSGSETESESVSESDYDSDTD